MLKPYSTTPVILFATPPPLEVLRALTIRVDDTANTNFPGLKMQPQVIKCREFLFTEPSVIGTPSLDPRDQCFHLVAQLSFLQSGKLQTRLSRVGLQVTKPYEVTPALYQSCLRYSLMARISPSWNKAGEWLVQGRDFLTHAGAVNAVKLDLTVNCDELYFTLEATALKLLPLRVTDLDLYGDTLEKFLKHRIIEIDHEQVASDWCYVLPSMKRGKIMSISYDIPDDSPFMSYRDIKRYWKNMYGFRLPESDEDMIYYQICFGPLGGRFFTYPEICLRARELQKVSRVDPIPILRDFVQEVTSKFPTICGAPMKLQSKAKFPLAELFESGQNDPQNHPNLTNKKSAKPSAYRSRDEMERMLLFKPDVSSYGKCFKSQFQNLPSSTFDESTIKNQTQFPRVRQQSEKETPKRQFENTGIQQTVVESLKDSTLSASVNGIQADSVNSSFNQKNINNRTLQYHSMETPMRMLKHNSRIQSNRSGQSSQMDFMVNSRIIYGKSCGPNDQDQFALNPTEDNEGNYVSSEPSVVRRLFPQFKPKKAPQVFGNTAQSAENQPPKIKPTFFVHKSSTSNVQKTSGTSVQRVVFTQQATANSVKVPSSICDSEGPSRVNTFMSSNRAPSSQISQNHERKIHVPLFFKKSLSEKRPVVEKQDSTIQKSAGLKKMKLPPKNKERIENGPKAQKRSLEKACEVKKKKVKQHLQQPEQ